MPSSVLALALLVAVAPGFPAPAEGDEEGPYAALVVTLEDEEGHPVVGIPVSLVLEHAALGRGRPVAVQDAAWRDGRLVFEHLPAGTFRARLVPDAWLPVTFDHVPLGAGETTDLGAITLRRGPSIRGVVTDGEEPVAGATVRALCRGSRGPFIGNWQHATTDPAGRFVVGNLLEDGRCRVVVEAPGFATWEAEDAAQDEPLVVRLERPGTIAGCAVIGERHLPAARTEVRGSGPGEPETARATADDRGCFRLEGLAPGTWRVRLLPAPIVPGGPEEPLPGTATSRPSAALPRTITGITVLPGEEADLGTIVLDEGVTLHGRVVDGATGAPLPGVPVVVFQGPPTPGFLGMPGVRLLSPESDDGSALATDADGRFTLAGIPPGTVNVLVLGEGGAVASELLEVPGDVPETAADIALWRDAVVEGRVLLPGGTPAAGCSVSLELQVALGWSARVRTDRGGRFRFERVPRGRTSLRVRPPEGEPALPLERVLVVPGRGTLALGDLVLPRAPQPVVTTGRVLLGDRALPARLEFRRTEPPGDRAAVIVDTDGEGRYRARLTRGTWDVVIRGRRGNGDEIEARLPLVVPADRSTWTIDLVVPEGEVRVSVAREDGRPLPGARVGLWPATGSAIGPPELDPWTSVWCDDAGDGRVTGVPSGRWWIAVDHRDMVVPVVNHPLEVGSNPARLRAVVPGRVRVTIRVVDAEGWPVPGAAVGVLAGGREPFPVPVSYEFTDEEGLATLLVPPGPDLLVGAWEPFHGISIDRLLLPPPGEPAERELVLARGTRVVLHPVADGKPVSGARVDALVREGGPDLTASLRALSGLESWRRQVAARGPREAIALPALPPGTWRVRVVAGGRCGIVRFRTPGGDPLLVRVDLGKMSECEF